MTLRLDNRWVWDFWFAVDGERIHVFFLQAERALGDAELRHWNVSIGHAVSNDLHNWTTLPDALAPSARAGDDDSLTTWTGSIIRHAGEWRMFYTGTSRRDQGKIQRIRTARSTDLTHWERDPGPEVAPLDRRWYETWDPACWHDQSWRDPWVVPDPDAGGFRMFLTCRTADGPPDGRGAIGQAVSTDLKHWRVGPPILAPGDYGEMEVPQVVVIDNRYYLLCSVSARYHSEKSRGRPNVRPRTGTIQYVADRLSGPWRSFADPFLAGDEVGSLYAGRLVHTPMLGWNFMAFRNLDTEGRFIGQLSKPFPVTVGEDGRLELWPVP